MHLIALGDSVAISQRKAMLAHILGKIYRTLGHLDQAIPMLEDAKQFQLQYEHDY